MRVCVSARTEGKRALLLCPVLLLLGCGREPVEGGRSVPATVESFFDPAPPAVFLASIPSDTVQVRWRGRGPLVIGSVEARAGDTLGSGDTIALGVDSLVSLELDRVTMNIEFASSSAAANPQAEDSALLASLASVRDSLQGLLLVPVLATGPGVLLSSCATGSRVMPGGVVATLEVSPDSVFRLAPAEGVQVVAWPRRFDGAELMAPSGDGALYSGRVRAGEFTVPGSISLPRQAIGDAGLGSFVVLEDGDTVSVMRVCISGDAVTVLPDGPLNGRVLGWAPAVEDR